MEPKFRRIIFYYDKTSGAAYMELVSANVFDARTREHLISAWMNQQTWELTKNTRIIHIWSTSRNELWRPGTTSGNEMEVVEAFINEDCDAIDFYVDVDGNGQKSCFCKKIL